jgi:arylformamidase
MAEGYIDISVPLWEGMALWPSDPRLAVEHFEHLSGGVVVKVSGLHLGSHTGTHVDAPVHFSAGEGTVDNLPLDRLIGPAEVFDLRGVVGIGAKELGAAGAGRARRVLLKTDNSEWVCAGPIPATPAYVTEDGAELLVEAGVELVGVDGLSVAKSGQPGTHVRLLAAGVVVVETVDLSAVAAGEYDLICLPLRVKGGDAAPARAVLRPRAKGRA